MIRNYSITFTLLILILNISACIPEPASQLDISVYIQVDGEEILIQAPAGSNVQDVLDQANLSLGQLDRIIPELSTTISDGMEIIITRVLETYESVQEDIPFDRQELPNESMPAGESRLIQAGQNGTREKTLRRIYEDGIETTSIVVSDNILQQPVPEILMIGVKNPFTSISIPGRIIYLKSGNAWLMERSTANCRPIVITGDLDGRILSLSPDGRWLLYSRKSTRPADQEINTLWVADLEEEGSEPVNLNVSNIIHFAEWRPGDTYTIAYSTVEPRTTAPGWQANNDLFLLPFYGDDATVGVAEQILDSSSGGIYGWWGTNYLWSPDGTFLAYSRPDGIGLVDVNAQVIRQIIEITPYNTYADWAWIPGLTWGNDLNTIFYVTHSLHTGLSSPEESPFFDLAVTSLSTGSFSVLSYQVGMFSHPQTSPSNNVNGENVTQIAYLQAIFPSQSANSRYRLMIMDRDGSEPRVVFPTEGQVGIEPQTPKWAPISGSGLIALLYGGDLWIIDTFTGQAQQVTSDGLTNKLDWK